MNEIVLETSCICKSYADNPVLKDVSITIRKGEVHALMGENGAGKSTLVKIITGVVKPTAGSVTYRGELLNITHPKDLYKYGIGIVYQEFNLMPDLTVAQNIFIGREPSSIVKFFVNERKLNEQAKSILMSLECNIDTEKKVMDLSVAEQQMVEIAKALSYNCQLLIMDEPTSALTESEIKVLFDIVRKLRQKGVAIIYISHKMSDLDAIADVVSVLRDGNLISTRKYIPGINNELIREMVGRDLTQQFPPKPDYNKGRVTLEVEHLSSPYKLHDISFQAFQGEILGIVGLMGAGRTELMKAIFGAYPRHGGAIKVNGKEVNIKNPRDAISVGIGYLTEDRKKDGLMLGLSLKENIASSSYKAFSKLGFMKDKLIENEVAEYVKRMSIKTFGYNQLAQTLSGGNQQKVMVAKWLCTKVKILIFDEPTRGIDVKSKYEIYELMYELVKNGVSVIMISSEMPETLGMSDRILVMSDGKITGDFLKEDATQEKLLQYAMLEG